MIKSSKIYFDSIFGRKFSILFLVLAVCLVLSFAACGDSVSVNHIIIPPELEGTWVTSGDSTAGGDPTFIIVINADGTGTFDGEPVRWKADGDELTLISEVDGTTTTFTYNISGDGEDKQLIFSNPSGSKSAVVESLSPFVTDATWQSYLESGEGVDYLGKGEPDKPFLVRNKDELGYAGKGTDNTGDYKAWTRDKSYKQVKDIDMTGQTWTPVGKSGYGSTYFTGTYNGGWI